MSDSQHDSTPHADNPAPSPGEAERVARRRKLVGLALSGAPLMMSLPTAVSAAAVSSAYRAAQNDAAGTPVKEATATDSWLRVPAAKLTPKSGTTGLVPLYKIGLRYYVVAGGAEAFSITEADYDSSAVFLLVLFDANYVTPVIDGGVPHPIRTAGQGLHLSAWNSVNPSGPKSYDGVAWVS